MKRQIMQKRVEAARRLYGDASPAVVVDAPLGPRPGHLAVLRLPVRERAWLMVFEAADHIGRDRATTRNWDRRSALPNTDRRNASTFLYLRPDLDRVVNGPHRGSLDRYPDFERLLEQIASAAI